MIDVRQRMVERYTFRLCEVVKPIQQPYICRKYNIGNDPMQKTYTFAYHTLRYATLAKLFSDQSQSAITIT